MKIRSRLTWLAASALLLPLAACAGGDSQAAQVPPKPAVPAETPAKTQRVPLEATPPKPVPAAEPKPVPAPEPESKPDAPARPTDVSVTGFETGTALGPDGHVTDPKSAFAATDNVRLVVLADGAQRPIRLAVAWLGPDGARITEDVQDVTPNGVTAVPFALSNPKGLDLGNYKAEIRIEGWLATTAEFVVR